jgi:ACS family hexuronate transporter-like MFS transporter
MESSTKRRWTAASVLYSASALNYLDRTVLSAIAPTLLIQFAITKEDFGYVLSAFSIVYAFSAPVMGLFIDRVGLTIGAAAIVGLWSLAGMSTAFVSTFAGLLLCRASLGFAEAGGIPAAGKGSAVYLDSKDQALGSALSQVGITVGTMIAPLLVTWLQPHGGWQLPFVVSGALGLVWIPIWLAVARGPVQQRPLEWKRTPLTAIILRDRRFHGLIAANILAMTVYSLWFGWSTLFLVDVYKITQKEANLHYVWLPPIFATLGGLCGGWLARSFIRQGTQPLQARVRIAFIASIAVLPTALAPLMPTPALATSIICLSLFATTALSVNYYTIPIDLFGTEHAAFCISALTAAFGLMQAFLSPVIGHWCTAFGWPPVCLGVAALPLLSVAVLKLSLRRS